MRPTLACVALLTSVLSLSAIAGDTSSGQIKGRLSLTGSVIAELDILRDDLQLRDNPAVALNRLPAFEVDLVQVGQALIPLQRGPQPGDHPHWEYSFESGRLNLAPGDSLATEIELPLSLHETDSNCLHNGILSLELGAAGTPVNARYTINSETCVHLKFNLQAELQLEFQPFPDLASELAEERHQANLAHRLPVKDYSALQADFPGINVQAFYGGKGVSAEHTTTAGFVIDNTHYSGGCPTRDIDSYKACNQMGLPSYSLAKSLVAGLGLMRLEKLYPGVAKTPVAKLVPGCAHWGEITLEHTLNMVTGRYGSLELDKDEDSLNTVTYFFLAPTHDEKLNYSCNAWPSRVAPGETWAYHTTDTYVLGTAMNTFLRHRRGENADYYRDLLVPMWQSLTLSATTDNIRRSRDEAAQPFTGFGMTLLPDDVAKLGVALNRGSFDDLLDHEMISEAMQRHRENYGNNFHASSLLYYRHGFWALDVTVLLGCSDPLVVPFMSGYGGLNLVMMPNDTVYYIFSDNDEYDITSAIAESHRLRPMCDTQH